MSNHIVVELTGGLGNQLFGFAAGLEQARRLGAELVLDISNFDVRNPREYALASLNLPFDTHKKNAVSRKITWPTAKEKQFVEKSFNYSAEIDRVEMGTTLHGYFQSPKYFTNVREEVLSYLSRLASEQFQVDLASPKEVISIHVRRGDYMNIETANFHGISSSNYFRRAISLITRLQEINKFRVFSDSIENVKSEFIDFPVELAYVERNADESPWLDLFDMANAKSMIMSNSSFSWWSAFIMSQFTTGNVIAPRPWFANGESASDLLLEDWLTLDAR